VVVIAGLANVSGLGDDVGGVEGELSGLWSCDWTAELDDEPPLDWLPTHEVSTASAKRAIAIVKLTGVAPAVIVSVLLELHRR